MLDSKHYESAAGTHLRGDETTVKVLVAGHFGVGKTTYVKTLSAIRPLLTEEVMTAASIGTDDLSGVPHKTTTTVAMDFGRMSLSDDLVLYLFGAPGQQRFWSVVGDLARGALGALVLADTRRLGDSYPVIGLMEELGLPYAVAVNRFDGAPEYGLEQLRDAMDLEIDTPLVLCDARDHASAKGALVELVAYLIALAPAPV
ncbi:ATP/GTP-binding protein [Streptomyces sp. NBC_01497]|nr:ATP/GTP-binding protein [Streptomyces sp. NBC_01497]